MSTRRSFLRQLVTTTAGLLVAPDALELIAEPSRRYWPGASFGGFERDDTTGSRYLHTRFLSTEEVRAIYGPAELVADDDYIYRGELP